jgi:hypothetical protein
MLVFFLIYSYATVMLCKYLYRGIMSYHSESEFILTFKEMSERKYLKIVFSLIGFCLTAGCLVLILWLSEITALCFNF